MGLKDKKTQGLKRILKSFGFAIEGIRGAISSEMNIRVHLYISLLVIGCSFYFSLSKTEWLFIIFAIGGMLALELINTAIERTVDLATDEIRPLAKQAKDVAAGAVFIYAIMSVVVGIIIFLPKL